MPRQPIRKDSLCNAKTYYVMPERSISTVRTTWGVGADIIRPPDELVRSFTIVGQYVYKAVLEIHRHYPFIFVDTFTIMPNHIHLLLRIDNMIEAENSVVFSKTKSISTVIGQMKRTVSAQAGYSVWQKSFYDRIVRNDKEYSEIWQYINSNPFVWEKDY